MDTNLNDATHIKWFKPERKIKMENNIFTLMMSDIRQLENENINLKIARGDYGFLAPGYGASIYSSIIKPYVTAEEYDLLRTFNINMPKDMLVRCMNIIQRLIDDGVIDNPPYYSYNGYAPFMEKEEPTPSYVGKPGTEFKLTPTNHTYNGEVIELTFSDVETVDKVHDQLKGTIDYVESNVILNREHKTMTVCVESLINVFEIMPIIHRVITDMMVRGATKPRSTTGCDFKPASVSDVCQFDLNGSPIIDDTDTTESETENETEE